MYSDNSISASDARKNRPGYDALVTAYEAGQFDALVCFDLDRLTRQPCQLEDWIDAAEGRGLALVTLNGEADLTTDGGRTFARIKLAVARWEVERKSARQRAAANQRALRGEPPLGVRLTGYTPNGETVAEEAAVVRRIFTASTAVNRCGHRHRAHQRRDHDPARTTVEPEDGPRSSGEPRCAGRVIYQGEVVTGLDGGWEPLVSGEVFDLIQARLADTRRRTQHGTDRKHLDSGLYMCGHVTGSGDQTCDAPVRGWSGNRYRCREGCVNRAVGQVDDYVEKAVIARLRRPDLRQRIAAAGGELRSPGGRSGPPTREARADRGQL